MEAKDILEVTQGLIDIVKGEQANREGMQAQINKLTCEVAELRTEIKAQAAK